MEKTTTTFNEKAAQTVPVSFQTYRSITDSKGLFKTGTDIISEASDNLPVNSQILGTIIKSFQNVIGDNIVFENAENKNIYTLGDDLTKDNNKLTQDKGIMLLYSDFMAPLEFNIIDQYSLTRGAELISDSIASMMIARNDFTNLTAIDEIHALNCALGQVKIAVGIDGDAPILPDGRANDEIFKSFAKKYQKLMLKIMRTRSKFSKGFSKTEYRAFGSQDVSINLQAAKTGSFIAGDKAYESYEKTGEPQEIFGQYYQPTIYLGEAVPMSEYKVGGTTYNLGEMTGQLIKPFNFADLHGMLVFMRSIAYYGHMYGSEELPMTNSRMKKVGTYIGRMNCAVKPIYARFNYSFVTKIPVIPSYVDRDGSVIRAYDLSKADDFNAYRDMVFKRQPSMYSAFFDGASKLTQAEVDKIGTDAIFDGNPKSEPITLAKLKKMAKTDVKENEENAE